MKKLLMTLTISVVASIMIIGALIASPDAYSDKKNGILDECKCEKPDTLIFDFFVPDGTEMGTEFRIEIFKKLADRDNPDKLLLSIKNLEGGETNLPFEASAFGKDKLESNTSFVVYEVDGGIDTETKLPVDVIVALIEIHTSCSKPLYQGLTKENNGYSITVVDGLLGEDGDSSIPIANASICEDEKKKSTGTITVKKAFTNDNGGTATFADFTITVTNESNEPFDLVRDMIDPSISTIDVPAGTYTLDETELDGYTTVLIAGDTGCPSMVNEEFTIKKNKNLSCTIYNDDNFDASTGGPGGIVFQNNSLQILINEPATRDSCDNPDKPLPCVQIIPGGVIAIVDPELGDNTRTIILFSVVEDIIDEMTGAVDPKCTIDILISHDNTLLGAVNPTSNTAVVLNCPMINSGKVLNVNYVMIDPGM